MAKTTNKTITRTFKGKEYKVTRTKDGFIYKGKTFTSPTAVAKAITGYKNVNGRVWLGI